VKVEKIYRSANKNELNGNLIIWKYMSIEKFISMLSRNTLYFSNASLLEDKFEVSIPNSYKINQKNQQLNTGLGKIHVENNSKKEDKIAKNLKENTYLNCWSLSREESYALWKIYLGGSKNGVAIKSTISKLTKSIETRNGINLDFDKINLGKVNYGEIRELNKNSVILTKQPFYEYEKELRLFFRTSNEFIDNTSEEYKENIYPGIFLEMDALQLVDQIVLSPFAPKWFNELVPEIIDKFEPELVSKIDGSQILV
jgi:hypothetical protein